MITVKFFIKILNFKMIFSQQYNLKQGSIFQNTIYLFQNLSIFLL